MDEIPDILKTIVEHKKEWIAHRRRRLPLDAAIAAADDCPPARGFAARIHHTLQQGSPAVIAEIKKASPGSGLIRERFHPAEIARSYAENNAACLSVLTDRKFFQGDDTHLSQARNACAIPVLRKDFIMAPYQIYESRTLGADCVLLMVSILSDMQLQDLAGLAAELHMDVLVEVHDPQELQRGLLLPAPLLGVNNRDLRTFKTDLRTTLDLPAEAFNGRTVVTESGIRRPDDVRLMRENNINAFLVGEAFMQADDPGKALTALFFN